MTEYPRLLFVTAHAFNRTNGGGVTFSSLFAGWPKDQLATVHCDSTPVTTDVCDRYYRLGSREIRKASFLDVLYRMKRDTEAKAAARASVPSLGANDRRTLVRTAKHLVFGDGIPEAARLSSELSRWIADFRPDIVYSILGSNALMDLVDKIRTEFRLPIAVHFMDDWRSTIYRGGLLSPLQRAKMERNLRRLIADARVRMGICEAMCTAYEHDYGRAFIPFQNAVDFSALPRLAASAPRQSGDIRVVYSGAVLPFAQLDSLADCCRAVALLRRQGMSIRMDVICPSHHSKVHRRYLEVDDCISVYPSLPDWGAYYRRISGADILLLPANFDRFSINSLRYSMPTKVPEYMSTGVPILVYGPDEIAQVRYAQRDGWGHVVTTRDVQRVASAMREMIADEGLRNRLTRSAQRVARRNHDVGVVGAAFRQALVEAVA